VPLRLLDPPGKLSVRLECLRPHEDIATHRPAREIHDSDVRPGRSFVTRARKAGISESVVMRMSGHKTRAVFDRYNVVDDSPQGRWISLDAFWTR
jgi:hypothetical protein